MRKILALIVIAFALYSGYWFYGERQVERSAREALAGLAQSDIHASYETLNTIGFPNRFDTTVTELGLVDRASAIGIYFPILQVFSLSYRPNHVIVSFPPEMELGVGDIGLPLFAEEARASITAGLGGVLPLQTATVSSARLELKDQDLSLSTGPILMAVRQQPGADAPIYDAFAEVTALRFPKNLRDLIDPAGTLPEAISQAKLDLELEFASLIGFDTPSEPQLTRIHLRDMRVAWGDLEIKASGQLNVDAAGVASGKIDITAHNWRRMLEIAHNAGVLTLDQFNQWQTMASVMARGADDLTLPLEMQGGRMSLGPFPLGAAPRF